MLTSGAARSIYPGWSSYCAGKAAVDHALGGRPERLGSFNARFSGVVFPGETVVTRIWDEGDHLAVTAEVKERAASVLSNGVMTLRP